MKLYVNNERQVALFHLELQGQISDGHWENSGPNDHWQPWCNADAVVRPGRTGRDFYAPKDTYMLHAKSLLEVVGERMMIAVRLTVRFGVDNASVLSGLFELMDNNFGMPTYDGAYYDGVRARIVSCMNELGTTLDEVRAIGEDSSSYGMEDLKNDLRDLRKIFKRAILS
jgi:hypothetical protein